jgi:hypothetical protein
MSGYDEKTGIFELTSTKIDYWFRRDTFPEGFHSDYPTGCMEFIVDLLTFFGYEIVKNGGNYLRVKATPEQLWEALSGQPSNPERAKGYYSSKVNNG